MVLSKKHGLTIADRDGEVIFRFDPKKGKDAAEICKLIGAWASGAKKYHTGEITREEYDKWRYYYPKYDDTQITARIPSKEIIALLLPLHCTMC